MSVDTMDMAPGEADPDAQKWQSEIRAWERRVERWHSRADAVIKRYRDERSQSAMRARRMSVLWANVQTLAPALYSKTPIPIVERRYLDRDPVGRVACQILERGLRYSMEDVRFSDVIRLAVQDRLLPGLGSVWVRYDPEFGDEPLIGSDEEAEAGPDTTDEDQAEEDTEEDAVEESSAFLTREKISVDYVYWKDFLFGRARVWDEEGWVGRRVRMTRQQLVERFGDVGREIPLDAKPTDLDQELDYGVQSRRPQNDAPTQAEIYEIWCKQSRSVYWVSKHYPALLDERSDPLHLDGFWPCPKPLLATTTTETLVPIPDYALYQDQAQEIDDLTGRIALLTRALKVAGVYDASVQELSRLLSENTENKLIPVKNWGALSEKGGIPGAVSFIPLKEVADTLVGLYEARERVKADLYEITGLSDIIRGQAQGAGATATEQRIKGQFASLRLQDRQTEVAEFCRSILRIMGEVIAEHYTPETLVQIAGVEFIDGLANLPPKPEPPPQMGHNGGPPMDGAQPPQGMSPDAQYQMAVAQWQAQVQQARQQIVTQAIQLLRDEKLRGFRIEIETDSTLQADPMMDKEARSQLLQSSSSFIQQAIAAGQQDPDLVPLMGQMLLFGLRGFRVGRDLESAFEDYIDQATANVQKIKSAPKPPSPEEVKAQTEQAKGQLELQKMQLSMQQDQQRAQLDAAKAQGEHQMAAQDAQMEAAFAQQEMALRQQELEIKQAELNMKRQEIAMKMQAMQAQHQMTMERATVEPSNGA